MRTYNAIKSQSVITGLKYSVVGNINRLNLLKPIIITSCLLIFTWLSSVEGYGQDGLPCDANGSGTITAADVTALINDLRNRAPAQGNADCNNSGTVTAADVTALINVLRGRAEPPM